MTLSKGLINFLLISVLSINTYLVFSHFKSQTALNHQLSELRDTMAALRSAHANSVVPPTSKPDSAHQNERSVDNMSSEILHLVENELRPIMARQEELIQTLVHANASSPEKNTATAGFVDLELEVQAFDESSTLLDKIIAGNSINIEDTKRLHELGQQLSEESKRELRDRIITAINSQQLSIASDFVPPF